MERVPSCDFMFIEQPDYQIIIDVSKNGDVIGVSWFKMPVESTSKEQINKICDILDKAKKIVINRKHKQMKQEEIKQRAYDVYNTWLYSCNDQRESFELMADFATELVFEAEEAVFEAASLHGM